MQLLYTGAKDFQEAQTDAGLSLGGYVSNTPIPLEYDEAIFSEITGYAITNELSETKCICLHNNSLYHCKNIVIKYEYLQGENSFADFEIGIIKPFIDAEYKVSFERVLNARQKPKYVSFEAMSIGDVNAKTFLIEQLMPNEYVGIWLFRKVNKTRIEQISHEILEKEDLSKDFLILDFEWEEYE